MSEKTDQELIDRVLGGDLAHFEELMQRYERLVYRVAYGFARNRDDTLDLTQMTFLNAYKGLNSFHAGSSFRAWLIRITTNEGVSWLRRTRRHREGREQVEAAEKVAAQAASAESKVLGGEQREQLLEGLERLGPRYRQALSLRYFHEMSIREIAGALDCSEGVVKSLLFRGVRKLRDELAPT